MKRNNYIDQKNIAVLIPCYNEALTIENVIKEFKKILPNSLIFVYDNNSTDNTYEIAEKSGAIVRREYLQGKGNVVRRMFADINADIYVLIDGDGTYNINDVSEMVDILVRDNADMVVGCRSAICNDAYRRGHRFGNYIFTKIVSLLFGKRCKDIFSGYRVFSRRFVKSFPAESKGFEIETEMTVHSLQLRLNIAEVDTPYYSRPPGSFSKLNTYKDGWKIFKVIIDLIISERPLLILGTISALSLIFALVLFVPVLTEYYNTGLVPRYPTLIVSVSLAVISIFSLCFGYLYDRVAKARREIKRLFYLCK